MEYRIRARLSWLRFLGFDPGAATPDANATRRFREKLREVGALDTLLADVGNQLRERGCLAMGGHIVEATLWWPRPGNATPGLRRMRARQARRTRPDEIRPDKPTRAARKAAPMPAGH